jgi:hypothetical protein
VVATAIRAIRLCSGYRFDPYKSGNAKQIENELRAVD